LLSENKKDISIVICSRDNVGYGISSGNADALLSLGIKTDFHRTRGLDGNPYRSFIAIIDGGKIVFELLGNQNNMMYEKDMYFIESTVWKNGKCEDAKIVIGGTDQCTNKRGLNIVVVDKKRNAVIDSVCFDHHKPEYKCIRTKN